MNVIHLAQQRLDRPVVLMIGNYDGVHLGHQEIIRNARRMAEAEGLETAVLSFAPHPLKLIAPERAPKLLQTPEQKEALLRHFGVDHYLLLPFDAKLSRMSPRDFVSELKASVDFRKLLVGFNFRFGHKRAGNTDTLAELGGEMGFETHIQPAFTLEDDVVSSSRIRLAVADGSMDTAERLLGRPYFVDGQVGSGDQLGKKMNAPTANVAVRNECLPRFGVYASWTRFEDEWYRSITNIGVAPTTGRDDVRFETHLLHFSRGLYDHYLFVTLTAFMRPEHRFNSLDELKQQIFRDIAAREAMADTHAPTFLLEAATP